MPHTILASECITYDTISYVFVLVAWSPCLGLEAWVIDSITAQCTSLLAYLQRLAFSASDSAFLQTLCAVEMFVLLLLLLLLSSLHSIGTLNLKSMNF